MGNKKFTTYMFWLLLILSIFVFIYNLINDFSGTMENNTILSINLFLTFLIYSSLIKVINDDNKYKEFFINQLWKEFECLSELLTHFMENRLIDRRFNLLSRKINNKIGLLLRMRNKQVNGHIEKLKEEINELVTYASDNINEDNKDTHKHHLQRLIDNIEQKIDEIIIKIYE
ncbi:MAG: hypothetical protein RBT49_17680 [Bacteroidales bacterium]|nr:hypothetical protein [Bacteroidales bacterium]